MVNILRSLHLRVTVTSKNLPTNSVVIDADQWGDHVRLSDLEPKFVCQACGHRGADVRPLFEPARMGTDA